MTRPMSLQDGTGVVAEVPGKGIIQAYGDTVPADGADGYAPGCIWHHTDGTDDTALYVNEGTNTSADFNPIVSI